MIKLDMPKQDWVESVVQDFFKEGSFRGAYGLQMSMTGSVCDSQDTMLDVLERIISIPSPKRKLLRLKGMLHPTDPSIFTFIRSLKSYGFQVSAVLKDQPYQWIDELNWTILSTERAFVPYATNEVWYKPPVSDKILEPKILPQESTGAPVFLYLNAQGFSVAVTQEFMLNSRFNWNTL